MLPTLPSRSQSKLITIMSLRSKERFSTEGLCEHRGYNLLVMMFLMIVGMTHRGQSFAEN